MMTSCERTNDRTIVTGDVKYTYKPIRVSGSGQRSAYIEGQKLSLMAGIWKRQKYLSIFLAKMPLSYVSDI